jgi:hypothetical protein
MYFAPTRRRTSVLMANYGIKNLRYSKKLLILIQTWLI